MSFTASVVVASPETGATATASCPINIVVPTIVSPPTAKADPTGVLDAGNALTQWHTQHPYPQDNGVYPSGSKYQAEGGVNLNVPTKLATTGASLFRSQASTVRQLCLLNVGTSQAYLTDLTLTGPSVGTAVYDAAIEGQAGLQVDDSSNKVILSGKTTIQGFAGDGIYVGANLHGLAPATNVVITGELDIAWCGRHGISVVNGNGFTLQATGSMTGFGRDWIDLEPAGYNVKANNVLIDGLGTLQADWGQGFDLIGAKGVGPVDNVTVRNIVCAQPPSVSCAPNSPSAARRSNWVLSNITGPTNWPRSGSGPMWNIVNVDGVTITDCHVGDDGWGPTPQTRIWQSHTSDPNARLKQWLEGNGCTDVTVSGNTWG